jgi:hypothetical protein
LVRRGLLFAVLVICALAALPGAASADAADPIVYFGFTDGSYYPQGADVSFGFGCVSPSSGIISCEGSQPLGSKLDTFHAGTHTVSVTATDFDGRQTISTQTYTVIDITKPHVVFRTPSDGARLEQGSFVTVDYTCQDDPGGLGIFDGGCVGDRPVGYPLDTSHLGTFTFSVTAVDKQFNVAQQTVSYSVVDTTPPVITLASPVDGATFTLGQNVWTSFSCDDGAGSGMNGCKGDLPSGTQLDTQTIGTHTFTVNAFDRAGNVAHTSHAYSVVYDFAGFAPPAAAYPAPTSAKAGQSVPLKFSLRGDQGTDIFAADSPGWASCDGPDQPAHADGTLSYNASSDRYTFLAATPKAWAGTCHDFVMTLRDGTNHRARFTFTK